MLTSASGGVSFAYDPLLRLYSTSSGYRFAYDGLDLVAEYNNGGAMVFRHVFGPGVDEPVVSYIGSGTDRRFLAADERGTIVLMTDNAGTAWQVNQYDEFGKPGASNSGRFQYTGQVWLGEIGVQYSKARMYAPHLGRFLQPDPIGYWGGPNLYAYVLNDPVNYVDPLGLDHCPPDPTADATVCGHKPSDPFAGIMPLSWSRSFGPGTVFYGGGGGAAPTTPKPQSKAQCTGQRNINASIDAGVFLGYGGGFSLGFNYDAESGSLTAYASVRAGTGLGWIAGGGIGATSSAPSSGYSRSSNLAIGVGSYGGSLSSSGGRTSISGGISAGPKFGAEYSQTENLTETATILSGSSQCQ